jgi:carboxymethylenebutenolidase
MSYLSTVDAMTQTQSLLNSQSGDHTATRRTALKAALGVGYAATVGTAVAQTAIKTSSDGLTAGEFEVDVNGFKVRAYRAAPAGKTNLPVVLVIQEIFGVHEYIADTCRRFAKLGYMAIAPELFDRQGDPTKYNVMADLMKEVVSKVPDAQVMGDLDAMVKWAGTNGGDASKVAITGFCWGGRITWLYAAHSKSVKAGVAWYGRLVGAASDLTPKHPVDVAGSLNGPVLGLYGSADAGIPVDTVEKMKVALKDGSAAAKKSEFVVYEGAPHAFHADYRPSYRKEPAEDGFVRALAWFKANGVA